VTEPEPAPPVPATPRRQFLGIPGLTHPILALGGLWAAMALLSFAVKERTGTDLATCMFRRLTGGPCATCRGTRAAVRLAQADILGALAFNPLVTVFLIAGPLWLLWRTARPHSRPHLTKMLRQTLLAFFLIALAANWWYVIVKERQHPQSPPALVEPTPPAQ